MRIKVYMSLQVRLYTYMYMLMLKAANRIIHLVVEYKEKQQWECDFTS